MPTADPTQGLSAPHRQTHTSIRSTRRIATWLRDCRRRPRAAASRAPEIPGWAYTGSAWFAEQRELRFYGLRRTIGRRLPYVVPRYRRHYDSASKYGCKNHSSQWGSGRERTKLPTTAISKGHVLSNILEDLLGGLDLSCCGASKRHEHNDALVVDTDSASFTPKSTERQRRT